MTRPTREAADRGQGIGPSWYDAWDYARCLERDLGKRIVLVMSPVRSTKLGYGWRVTACLEDNPSIFGCGSFGPAFPGNGQRSFSSATYRALIALDERCAIAWAAPSEVEQFCLQLDSEA